jgi:hypothetical protein
MPTLFHVSEEKGIERFVPRPPPSADAGVVGDAVWAIDEAHLPNYLLPRDCPRVTFAGRAENTPEELTRFFGSSRAKRIVAIEEAWRARIAQCRLYLYNLPDEAFEIADANAGYFISRSAVRPLSTTTMDDPLRLMVELGAEYRFFDDLWPLRDAVIASSLEFSIIRWRNARPPKSANQSPQ